MRLSLHADDAILFSNRCREDISCLMDIMNHFGEATGLKINPSKSTVAPIQCHEVDLD